MRDGLRSNLARRHSSLPSVGVRGIFSTQIPISEQHGPELEHLGLIVYPHDRENCSGCAANRAIRETEEEALREMARKVDELFMGKKTEGR